MSKIKKEQLEKLHDQQSKLNTILNQIGVLEANKHGKLHELAGVNADIEEFKKELESEYGSVNINLEDGKYSKVEENESDKKD